MGPISEFSKAHIYQTPYGSYPPRQWVFSDIIFTRNPVHPDATSNANELVGKFVLSRKFYKPKLCRPLMARKKKREKVVLK